MLYFIGWAEANMKCNKAGFDVLASTESILYFVDFLGIQLHTSHRQRGLFEMFE